MVTSALCKRLKISNRPGEHTLRSFTQCLCGGIASSAIWPARTKILRIDLSVYQLAASKICILIARTRPALGYNLRPLTLARACTFLFYASQLDPMHRDRWRRVEVLQVVGSRLRLRWVDRRRSGSQTQTNSPSNSEQLN